MFLKFFIGVGPSVGFPEVRGIIQIKVQNNLGLIGKTEKNPVSLQPLFITPEFSKVSAEPVFRTVGILRNDVLVSFPYPCRKFDGLMLPVHFRGQTLVEFLDLFFKCSYPAAVELMVQQQITTRRHQELHWQAVCPTPCPTHFLHG